MTTLALLLAACIGGEGCRAAAAQTKTACCRTQVQCETSAQAGPPDSSYVLVSDDDDDKSIADKIRAPKQTRVRQAAKAEGREQADQPSIWIGVRMAPVPAALRAHLGAEGLMVANVAEGSPADDAGLQQFDVITDVNGESVTSSEGLVGAIEKAGRKTARVKLIRAGKETTVGVKPGQRPADMGAVKFKYEETPDAVVDGNMNFRGMMLSPDEHGKWIMRNLGNLENLPEGLESLKDLGGTFQLKINPEDMNFDVDLGDLGAHIKPFMFHGMGGGEGGDVQTQIVMKKKTDDGALVVERNGEGQITVKRLDADGNATGEETYDSEEALREADEEAADMLGNHRVFIGGHGGMNLGGDQDFIFQIPDGKNLPRMQLHWQNQIENTLQDVRKQIEGARIHVRKFGGGEEGGASSKAMSITVNDGKVKVITNEDGEVVEQEFDSIEGLKDSNPDLYTKLRHLFEHNDDDN